ncbi:MAG: hypothetical protein KC483_03620 [Nitrosarchaeum sp.]|nr:hypothetical protein [Nitrosarchaeum sp.]
MNTQTILQQKDWQSEPTEILVTSNPVKEGSKLDYSKRKHTEKTTYPEHGQIVPTNPWNPLMGLSWLFLEDVEDY